MKGKSIVAGDEMAKDKEGDLVAPMFKGEWTFDEFYPEGCS